MKPESDPGAAAMLQVSLDFFLREVAAGRLPWSSEQIAAHLGCSINRVKTRKTELGLTDPSPEWLPQEMEILRLHAMMTYQRQWHRWEDLADRLPRHTPSSIASHAFRYGLTGQGMPSPRYNEPTLLPIGTRVGAKIVYQCQQCQGTFWDSATNPRRFCSRACFEMHRYGVVYHR